MHLSHVVETIDTHTAGNPTRNLIAGVPRIEGKTMQDKMAYAEETSGLAAHRRHDGTPRAQQHVRHNLREPCHPEADMGILFIDAGGHYAHVCGHSTIGCASPPCWKAAGAHYRGKDRK